MQHAIRQSRVLPRVVPKKVKQVKRKQKNKAFNMTMIVVVLLFSFAICRVVQFALYNQFAINNETLMQKISDADQVRQELTSKKLALESPQRIESIAVNKLKMIKAVNIRYIVYKEPASAPRVAMADSKVNSNSKFGNF